MFRTVSIICFLLTLLGIGLHRISLGRRPGSNWRPSDILKGPVYLLTLLLLPQRLSLVGRFKKLVYLLALFCSLVLAVTGFCPVLIMGRHLAGYMLMIHVTAGGVFAACLVILAVTWAHQHRFNESDWLWLAAVVGRRLPKSDLLPKEGRLFCKLCFWLIVVLGLPLMLSVVLSMFPIFGTAGQNFLANTHRYSTLAFAVVAVVHTYLLTRAATSR
jgi:cytochrome b subunit of formate dehydrogenase